MTAIYNLVRCSDGKTVFSFPAGGRYLVDTSNGLQSMRPLMDDEIIFYGGECRALSEENWLSGNPARGVR